MKLIHRIGYYLGGFSIGLILLAFFLSGKKTSCDYGPNARTVKNISIKKRMFSQTAKDQMTYHNIDTLTISNLIKTGNVNFSKSDTKADSCKTYLIENQLDEKAVELWIKNCDSTATIQSLLVK
ncbi:hypothetical protein [Psychroserpens sp. SPM9]|uniref:hypothetical protein n=1 Tax=Psychroserpens sp. SPM9 TaxID=2975598 RepID=UPI0021A7FD80|nr:hypothetical protein [Psychroserpens sp. SPM9]MDG5491648.1 hypothetical protein [Psychroserpens sp. SPM9]